MNIVKKNLVLVRFGTVSLGLAVTLLEGDRTVHLPWITTEHANQWIISLQYHQKQCNAEDSTRIQIDRLSRMNDNPQEVPEDTRLNVENFRDNQIFFGWPLILLVARFCKRQIYGGMWRHADFYNIRNSANVLDIGNRKVAIDTSTGFITLPTDFCRLF